MSVYLSISIIMHVVFITFLCYFLFVCFFFGLIIYIYITSSVSSLLVHDYKATIKISINKSDNCLPLPFDAL